MSESEFWAAMDSYKAAFGEYFPTDECGLSDAAMVEAMTSCVNNGEPYSPYTGTPDDVMF